MNKSSFAFTCALFLLMLAQGSSAEIFTYQGVVTNATGALAGLTPTGTAVGGPVDITNPGPGGTAGIADINAINVNVGGFCFSSTPDPGACPSPGAYVPVLSIDAAAIEFDAFGFPDGGSFDITTFSPTFGINIPINFNLTAGTFAATTAFLGDVSGTAAFVRPPTLSITPNPVDFGPVPLDQTAFLDVDIQNIASDVAEPGVDSVTITSVGTPAQPFEILMNGCIIGQVLLPGEICTIQIAFTPTTSGLSESTFDIVSTAENSPTTVNARGSVLFTGPSIEVDPLDLSFGSPAAPIDVLTEARATTMVSNGGDQDLSITISFAGGDNEFSVDTTTAGTEDCEAAPIAPGESCTVTVVFAPVTEPDKQGTMTINSNDTGSTPPEVSLSGFVFRGSRLETPSLDIDVGAGASVILGNSASTEITIESTGTQDLFIASVTLGGPDASDFSITEDCSANPVATGSSCTIGVAFTPVVAGNKSASITIVSNSAAVTRGSDTITVILLSAGAVAPLTVPPDFTQQDVGGTGSAGWLLLGIGLLLLLLRRNAGTAVNAIVKGNLMQASGKLLGIAMLAALPHTASAVSFESESGDWYGSWDTTVSYGLAYRLQAAADNLTGLINGGSKFSVNGDDGTLNFNRSIYSNALKLTSELEINNGPANFSLFMRGFYFYDFELKNEMRERTQLSDAALDLAGTDGDLLDAFISWKFDIGERPAEIRIGEQVINWGESTFIQGGANVINHINVSALRVPGAELREALLPQDLVFFSVGLTPNADLEVVYQYDWDKTNPDAVGTYFSTNDFAVAGGSEVRLGFGDTPDFPNPDFFPFDRGFNSIPRGPSVFPSDDGQWGWALRYFAPDFNNGTEFGFYYYNYHSRLPLISARTGSFAGLNVAAGVSVNTPAIANAAGQHIAANPGDVQGAIDAAVALGVNLPQYMVEGIANATVTGGNVALLATAYATDAFANTPSTGSDPFGTPAGGTAQFFTGYPEDIQMYAVSINTTLGQTALQGEIAHHANRPLQIDDLEVLFAGLSPLRQPFAQFGQLGSFSFLGGSPQFNPNTPPLTTINGYLRRDYTQVDMALTRLFGPMFGADLAVGLFEVAMHHVHSFPDKDVLRFDAPGTVVSGNDTLVPSAGVTLGEFAHSGKPVLPARHFPDQNSWGYRLAGRLDYSNVFGSFNMSPRFAWQHDVDGITPGPAGAFIEGRKALTIGNRFTYQNQWEFDMSYSRFFGGGFQNEIHDRDFVAASVKFTF